MHTLWQDLRYAARTLAKQSGFTLVAVMTLALGIGANTTIFSVIDAVLLKPLPYPEPERLVTARSNQSVLNLADLQTWSRSFISVGGINQRPLDYTGGKNPVQVRAGLVTGGYFDTLGVQAALGRTLTERDDRKPVAVLRDEMWRESFGGDPGVLGTAVTLSGISYTVVGVMPAGFKSPRDESAVWVPIRTADPIAADYRGVHFLHAYFRLKPEVTLEQAMTEMGILDSRLAAAYPAENRNRRIVLLPLHERILGATRPALWMLFGAVSLVLLIACANFANLLVARGSARAGEFILRRALGAGRGRLVRQLLTESTLVACLGGIAGTLLAAWGIKMLVALKPTDLPRLETVRLDWRVLTFALTVSLLTGIVFGIAPAWLTTRNTLSAGLRESSRGLAGGGGNRLRNGLVVTELALSLILLAGAGLLIRSFWNLRTIQPGFDPHNLLTLRLELPEVRYREIASQTHFRHAVLEAANDIPGVQAAMTSELPLGGDSLSHNFIREEWNLSPGDEPEVETRSILGDYFRVMRIPLIAGREFTVQDDEKAPLVGIVNQALATRHFPEGNPIGKRVRWARDEQVQWITIVGVVGDVRHSSLDSPEEPTLYTPYPQSGRSWKRWMVLTLRTAGASTQFIDAVKQSVWKLDAQLPVTRVFTMDEVAAQSLAERRFTLLVLSVFAGVALALAASGIYGVIAFLVTHRTREFGVRLALGARPRDVLLLVGRHGAGLTAGGILIGLTGAAILTRLLDAFLFGVGAIDGVTFAGVTVLLVGVVGIAVLVPARRATKVDPVKALRAE